MPQTTYDNKDGVIKFRYLKPMGFSLPHVTGNFFPKESTQYIEVPGQIGRFPVEGYDMNYVHEVKIENEFPRELPDIFDDLDDEVRMQYIAKQATQAADAHERNNEVRKNLAYYAQAGYIEILSDSFLDVIKKKKSDKATKSPEAPVEDAEVEAAKPRVKISKTP